MLALYGSYAVVPVPSWSERVSSHDWEIPCPGREGPSKSGAAAESTPRVMGKISSCDLSIEWCIVKDGGGNANAAIVAAKKALMSTMATLLQIQLINSSRVARLIWFEAQLNIPCWSLQILHENYPKPHLKYS
jgi:hypothetical protein